MTNHASCFLDLVLRPDVGQSREIDRGLESSIPNATIRKIVRQNRVWQPETRFSSSEVARRFNGYAVSGLPYKNLDSFNN
jgi:hypothetical protein